MRTSKRVPVNPKTRWWELPHCVLVCVSKSWFDHYLQWNQSEHPGVKNLRFTTDQIWTPDILLYNR